MDLHIVGGFLGSGKTTAIVSASKYLVAQGKRVGVITNDQGKYLVDTAFVRLGDIPTVEVSGGCFCCNYGDLTEQIDTLKREVQPDVIFAESVGSCADVVATVVRPLREFDSTVSSFSVFADSRLLRYWLAGDTLPFSDNIVYLFGQQIAEAGLLVINKADLLTPDQLREVEERTRERFPDKQIRMQNSLDEQDVVGWIQLLNSRLAAPSVLDIDYDIYGKAEADLAWLDVETEIEVTGRESVLDLIGQLRADLGSVPIGHFKLLTWNDTQSAKISFPTFEEPDWQARIPDFAPGQTHLILNIRAQMDADDLRALVERVLSSRSADAVHLEAFHPKWPTPTHRLLS